MKKIHETLYKTPEMIKLFIVFCLFIYFLMDIVPARESMMEIWLFNSQRAWDWPSDDDLYEPKK